jgi:hypothetical protein
MNRKKKEKKDAMTTLLTCKERFMYVTDDFKCTTRRNATQRKRQYNAFRPPATMLRQEQNKTRKDKQPQTPPPQDLRTHCGFRTPHTHTAVQSFTF